jgi:N-acetylneuraminic acid mutarotase
MGTDMRSIVTALVIGVLLSLTSVAASAQGWWTTDGPLLPTPRSEIGAAVVAGQIFVLGGGVGDSQRKNEILDIAAGQWRDGTPMPRGLNHHGVTALNGRIYVFGGSDESGRPTNAALEYDPLSSTWRELSVLPTPRSSPGVAALNGLLYVVGGIGARNTPVVEIYDPATDGWSTGPALGVARDHFVLVESGGRLFAIGGRIGNFARNLDTVEILEPGAASWTYGAPMPAPRSGIAGSVLDGVVYVFGGEDPVQTFGEVFTYTIASDSWSDSTPPMPTPRHGLAAVEASGRIHVIGGGTSPGGGSDSSFHEILTP